MSLCHLNLVLPVNAQRKRIDYLIHKTLIFGAPENVWSAAYELLRD